MIIAFTYIRRKDIIRIMMCFILLTQFFYLIFFSVKTSAADRLMIIIRFQTINYHAPMRYFDSFCKHAHIQVLYRLLLVLIILEYSLCDFSLINLFSLYQHTQNISKFVSNSIVWYAQSSLDCMIIRFVATFGEKLSNIHCSFEINCFPPVMNGNKC